MYGYADSYTIDSEAVTISARGTIGYHTIREPKFTPIIRLITLVPKPEVVETKFLNYALMTIDINFSSTSIPQLTIPHVERLKIPLPPIEIQKQIVTEIESYQKIINGAQQIIDNWKPVINIDPNWTLVELGDICEIQRGSIITKKKTNKGNIPVVSAGKQPSYYHNEYNIEAPLITVSGSGNAGFVNFFDQPIWASDCLTIKLIGDKNSILFIYYLLKLKQEEIYKLQTGSIIKHVYPADLKRIKIPLPSAQIQLEIADSIKEEQQIISSCHSLIKKYENYIQTCINKL